MEAALGLILFVIIFFLIKAIIFYWQIVLGGLFGIFILSLAYRVFVYLPWFFQVKKSNLLYLTKQELYIIPLEWTKKAKDKYWKVKYVYPWLLNNKLSFTEGVAPINQLRLVKSASRKNLKLEAMKQVAAPTQEIFQKILPQMTEFQQQIQELTRLKNLALSSNLYSEKASLFSRAIVQLENLEQASKKLRGNSLDYIREILIGVELSGFNPDILPDPIEYHLNFQQQYNLIKEQYETISLEVEAYNSLSTNIFSG